MSAVSEVLEAPSDVIECCSAGIDEVLDQGSARQLAQTFKALGDPTRVRLISMIAAAQGAQACICDLIDPVGLSQPTVSHHMKVLTEAGLVTREQRGKWAYFRLVPQAFGALGEYLGGVGLGSLELGEGGLGDGRSDF